MTKGEKPTEKKKKLKPKKNLQDEDTFIGKVPIVIRNFSDNER